jgi:hypothetical protein
MMFVLFKNDIQMVLSLMYIFLRLPPSSTMLNFHLSTFDLPYIFLGTNIVYPVMPGDSCITSWNDLS